MPTERAVQKFANVGFIFSDHNMGHVFTILNRSGLLQSDMALVRKRLLGAVVASIQLFVHYYYYTSFICLTGVCICCQPLPFMLYSAHPFLLLWFCYAPHSRHYTHPAR